jgi:hypothetical protein
VIRNDMGRAVPVGHGIWQEVKQVSREGKIRWVEVVVAMSTSP